MARTIRLHPGAHVAVVAGRVVDLPAGAIPAALISAAAAVAILTRRGRLTAPLATTLLVLASLILMAARRPADKTLARYASAHLPRRGSLTRARPPFRDNRP